MEKTAKTKAQNRLTEMSRTYHDRIPVQEMRQAVSPATFDEEFILCGREGRTTFDLTENGKSLNFMLCVSWYRMDVSGRYEVSAYLS